DGARSPETRPDRAMVRGPVRELPAGMDLRLRGTMAGAALEPVPAGGLSIAGQRHRGARIPSQPPRDDRASPVALGWACALHVALAGVLMFLCGRAAGLSRAAATLAAIGFMLSERVLIERIHPPYLFGVAWLPAVFLAAGRVGSEPGAWRGAVLGAAVACLLLAGYPGPVCFTAYSLLLPLLACLVIRGVPAWSDLRRLMVAGIAAVATACALAAVQLPTLELAGEAVRSLKSLPLDQILAVPPPPWEASFSCRGRSSASRSPPSPVAGTFRSSSSAPCSSSSPVRLAS